MMTTPSSPYVRAYATALRLKPDYAFAIEYQGEAHLARGDVERAKFNYLRLYALDPALASKLLDAIREWSKHAATGNGNASLRAWLDDQTKR